MKMNTELDIKIEETLKAYMASGVEEQLDYQKFYLYSIVTHSTAIEGSTVTEIENQLLFDEGAAKGRSLTEQMMNINLNLQAFHPSSQKRIGVNISSRWLTVGKKRPLPSLRM